MWTKPENLIEELLLLVRKDPMGPNAGRFAETAGQLMAMSDAQAKEEDNFARFSGVAQKFLVDFEEKMAAREEEKLRKREEKEAEKNKPLAPLSDAERRANYEKAIAISTAQSVAAALLQEATGLEHMAELGRPQSDFGKHVTEGSLVRSKLDDDSRNLARKQAAELKSRAVEVLVNAGCEGRGNDATLLGLRPY